MKSKLPTNFLVCPACGTSINLQKEIELSIQEEIESALSSQLSGEKKKIESALRKQLKEENADAIVELQNQLKEKTNEIKNFNRVKADLARLKREKETMKEQIEADAEERLTQILKKERHKIQRDVQDKMQLKINANELLIKQLNESLKKAQEKVQQQSMQVQGEVLEIQLAKVLEKSFPSPNQIHEVPKGKNGCDLILTVRNSKHEECGSIAIESKNTKSSFSMGWIDKLKLDQKRHKCDIAILVTAVMPKNITSFGFLNGVWIVSSNTAELTALLFVIRESLLRIHEIKASNQGAHSKASEVYDYVRSNEFARQITAIVEGMTRMKSQLQKEQQSHARQWKEYDKVIDSTVSSAVEIISEIKSIAGGKLKGIQTHQLPLLSTSTGLNETEM